MASNLPIILSGYVPGQEEGNVTYVEENNVGMLAYDSVELINILRRMLKPGSELLLQELENAKRISRPGASFDIANCILGFLPPAGSPGVWKNGEGKGLSRVNSRRSGLPARILQPGVPALRSRTPMRTLQRRLRRLAFLQRPVHDLSQMRSRAPSKQEHDTSLDTPKVN